MRPTIPSIALGIVLCTTAAALAQPSAAAADDDPFRRGRWHVEFGTDAALEAWNYNANHEELYGLLEGLTYGLRDGLVVTMSQRVVYVSQRAQDTWLLGLTGGIRGRVYQRNRFSVFLGIEVGISDAAIAAPPRGTRFNYLVIGSAGSLVRLAPRAHLKSGLQWTHVSNNGLKDASRNPDIEAIGLTLGVLIRL
jgi:hypothetical protein